MIGRPVLFSFLSVAAALAACGDSLGEEQQRAQPPKPPPSMVSDEPNLSRETRTQVDFSPRCVDGVRAEQRHGATCLCCHAEFGVAGSIDREGPPVARIVVTDSRGDVANTVPNSFSNFFRHFTMTGPFRVVAYGPDGRSIEMTADAPSADCNACHYKGGPVPPIHGPP